MFLRSIQVESFRNLVGQRLSFTPGINLLVGDNGQGKTNLLEAVHLLASLRSFRPAKLGEMIGRGHGAAEVSAEVEQAGLPISLRLTIEAGGRRLWLGQRPVSAVGDFLGQFSAVAFTPDDLAMVKGGPSLRRRFADRAAFLTRPGHLPAVRQFSQALRARNRLLSEPGRPDELQLESFTGPLAEHGAQVSQARRELVTGLLPGFAELVDELSSGQLAGSLRFKAGWNDEAGGSAGDLMEQINARLQSDLRRQTTSIGPQLDDFEILLDERPARRYASQGQQRVCAVALLLAVVSRAVAGGHPQPVILLDDVSSELDAKVRSRLFDRVASLGGQVLVTSTDPGLADELGADLGSLFRVQQGRVTMQ